MKRWVDARAVSLEEQILLKSIDCDCIKQILLH